MLALKVVLDFMTIQFSPFMHLSFEFLAGGVVCMLFGPVAGGIYGFAGDILCFLANPKGPYFWGYTLIATFGGVVNGFILYGKKPTALRCSLERVFNVLVCNVTLNTLCSSLLYSKAFFAILPMRIVKNLALLPVEAFMLYFILKKVDALPFSSKPSRPR